MRYVSGPKSLAERLQWMAANLQGFREELDAVRVAELRGRFRQCVAEFHQFSHSSTSNTVTAPRRAQVAEIAGLAAASYLSDLGGLLAAW
jgi:hypothetical protein